MKLLESFQMVKTGTTLCKMNKLLVIIKEVNFTEMYLLKVVQDRLKLKYITSNSMGRQFKIF